VRQRERDRQSIGDSSIMQNKPAENNMDGLMQNKPAENNMDGLQ